MEEEKTTWGEMLLGCKDFSWRKGMQALRHAPGFRDDGRVELRIELNRDVDLVQNWGSRPDTADPGTQGALLALLREVFSDPDLHIDVAWHDGSRHIQRKGTSADRSATLDRLSPKWVLVASGATEEEALVRAFLSRGKK